MNEYGNLFRNIMSYTIRVSYWETFNKVFDIKRINFLPFNNNIKKKFINYIIEVVTGILYQINTMTEQMFNDINKKPSIITIYENGNVYENNTKLGSFGTISENTDKNNIKTKTYTMYTGVLAFDNIINYGYPIVLKIEKISDDSASKTYKYYNNYDVKRSTTNNQDNHIKFSTNDNEYNIYDFKVGYGG